MFFLSTVVTLYNGVFISQFMLYKFAFNVAGLQHCLLSLFLFPCFAQFNGQFVLVLILSSTEGGGGQNSYPIKGLMNTD